jgi:hypothetical protein
MKAPIRQPFAVVTYTLDYYELDEAFSNLYPENPHKFDTVSALECGNDTDHDLVRVKKNLVSGTMPHLNILFVILSVKVG